MVLAVVVPDELSASVLGGAGVLGEAGLVVADGGLRAGWRLRAVVRFGGAFVAGAGLSVVEDLGAATAGFDDVSGFVSLLAAATATDGVGAGAGSSIVAPTDETRFRRRSFDSATDFSSALAASSRRRR